MLVYTTSSVSLELSMVLTTTGSTTVLAFAMCLIRVDINDQVQQSSTSLNEAKATTDLSYGTTTTSIIYAHVGYISMAMSWAVTGILALEIFGVIIMAVGWILVRRELETETSETGK